VVDQQDGVQEHRIALLPSGRRGTAPEGTTVLDAAQRLGVGIESICAGRQTCGKCQVVLEEGAFPKHGINSTPDHLSAITEAEKECAEAHAVDLKRRRLACAARILGDVLIRVPEESQAQKQVIRKEASHLALEVEPALSIRYVEIEPASLGGASDWERLQDALQGQWGLQDVRLDPILLSRLPEALRAGDWAVTVTLWHEQELIRIEPGYVESLYGLAVDVGSTTIAGYLCDLRTGQLAATHAMMNPQIRFGEDLMSRVAYAMREAQGAQRMHRRIIAALNELAQRSAEKAGIRGEEICELVLVGNSVMHHLLLGIDPKGLGSSPFSLTVRDALDMKARDLRLKAVARGAYVHVLPCIAGHVGADNVGVLLAESPDFDARITLVVDIGTNAEILLGTHERVLSASSPTGPAFEGAQISHGQRAAPGAIERVRIDPETGEVRYRIVGDERWNDQLESAERLAPTGICGSGIVEAVAGLYLAGWIDSSGLFREAAVEQSAHVRRRGRTLELILAPAEETASGDAIVVTQADIRAVQLAKAALYAGVKLLMKRMGVVRVERIKLAGAFGSYIDPLHAMVLGLIPDCDLEDVHAVGNAAGDGARIALINHSSREDARASARRVEYVETAVQEEFQEQFVAAMALPHAHDPFPHLQHLLPEDEKKPDTRGSRRRRRASKDC
jgi:uncharacterized 2Fe-2S/4Fe-4S cluster protein (DUF4445 family)